jgi:hypothetical protein
MPGSPFHTTRGLAVGPEGDVYYLEFGPTSMTVNRIPPIDQIAAAERERLTQSGGRKEMVSLRDWLSGSTARVTWNPVRRAAVAIAGQTRQEFAVGKPMTVGGGDSQSPARTVTPRLEAGRVYLPSGALQAIFGPRIALTPAPGKLIVQVFPEQPQQ